MDFNEVHRTYTKINTLYMRDEKGNIMLGEFSRPELKYLYDCKWLGFDKVDGTNMSYYWDGHELQIHGKSEKANIPSKLKTTMEELISVEKMREVFPIKYDEEGNEIPFMVRIYGEGYGVGIQKCGGSYSRTENKFIVFDIMINGFWLEWDNVCDICSKLGLETVTCFGEMTLREAEALVIKGFKSPISENKELDAEGIVLRPLVQLFNKKGERIMVKIKTCDYKKCGITYEKWLEQDSVV